MTTYVGNPPKSVYGVKEATNVVHDFVTDGTTIYDLDVDFENDGIYDVAVITSGSLSETLSVYDTSDLTNANYLTQYWHVLNGTVTSAGADADSYMVSLQTSCHYTGSISWAETSSGSGVGYLMWEGTTLTYQTNIREQHYSGYYNSTARAAPSKIRLVKNAGTALSAGTRIIITKREATNLILPLEYSAPRKNILINSDFAVNQRGYVSGTAKTASTFTYDHWRTGGVANSKHTLSGIEMTIDNSTASTDGVILQPIEKGSLIEGNLYTVSWKGTSKCSVWYANGETEVLKDSPFTFIASAGSATVDDLLYFTGDGTTLSEPKLEEGTSATPWEKPDITTELNRCKRYFQGVEYRSFDRYNASNDGTAAVMNLERLPIEMRGTPAYWGKSSSPTVTVRSVYDNVVRTTTGAIVDMHWNPSKNIAGAYISGGLSSLPTTQYNFNLSTNCTVYFEAEL